MRLVPLELGTSVFGEYRNVLGANELDRSELTLGEKLRGLGAAGANLPSVLPRIGLGPRLNEGPGELNEGCGGVIWKDLPEPNGPEGIAGAGLA
jgi:hypothetical protein